MIRWGAKCQIWPSRQIRAVGHCEWEGEVHHSFNICPKALHGSPKQCCNMHRRIGKHQNIQEEWTRFKEDRIPNLVTDSTQIYTWSDTLTGYESDTWLDILYGPQLARVDDEYVNNACCQRHMRDYPAHHTSLFDRYDRYILRDIEDIFDVRMPLCAQLSRYVLHVSTFWWPSWSYNIRIWRLKHK